MVIVGIFLSIVFLPIGLLSFFGGIISLFKSKFKEQEEYEHEHWPQAVGKISGIEHERTRNSQGYYRNSKYYYYLIEFRDAYGRDAIGHSQRFVGEQMFQVGQSVTVYVGSEHNTQFHKYARKFVNFTANAISQALGADGREPDPRPVYTVKLWNEQIRATEKNNSLAVFFIIFGGIWLTVCVPMILKAFGVIA